MEQTFVMLKPETVQRGLAGTIVQRIENKGFRLVAMKMMVIDESLANKHYAEHEGKDFFPELVQHICSGPVVAMVWEGIGAIAAIRSMMGKTNPLEATPGTIRGDYGATMSRNMIHGSDAIDSARREISLFFKDDEVLTYNRTIAHWI
ncbi:MAG: nucleoside-diphosphate kinase [Bacillota bacterium]|nr:nucleoside-diphosphate kinase [Bacillota bacterium]